MRKLLALLASLIMTLTIVTLATPVGATAPCPRVLGGDWYGEWSGTLNGQPVEHDIAGYTFFAGMATPPTQIMGTIDLGLSGGQRSIFSPTTINCDTLTFSTNEPYFGATSWTVVYAPDARTLSGSFTAAAGTFTFNGVQVSADDPQSISVSDTSILEGDIGAHDATIPVTLNAPWTAAVTVQYRVLPMTAMAGMDYTDNGTVHSFNIAKGQVQKNITVPVIPNDMRQDDRTFGVLITSATAQQVYSNLAIVTIRDDDYSKD